MNRPSTLNEVARRVLDGTQTFEFALSEFLDEFYADPIMRAVMLTEEPPALPDRRQHAALGAVAEHLARRWDVAIPTWCDTPSRFLDEPWFTTPLDGLKAMLLVQSPLAFRRRLIFTEAEPLRRARMPRSIG